jgi:hypothetical protein
MAEPNPQYDLFISHASEDKEGLVSPRAMRFGIWE